MKVLVEEDKSLDTTERAIYFDVKYAEEAMLNWTLNNKEHLLCYIIRTVPRCNAYQDEFVKAVSATMDETLLDDLNYKEEVYMQSGFKRKHHFNVGDEVQYIFYDGKNATLRKSCIAELTNNNRGILMREGHIVPERYVFPI